MEQEETKERPQRNVRFEDIPSMDDNKDIQSESNHTTKVTDLK